VLAAILLGVYVMSKSPSSKLKHWLLCVESMLVFASHVDRKPELISGGYGQWFTFAWKNTLQLAASLDHLFTSTSRERLGKLLQEASSTDSTNNIRNLMGTLQEEVDQLT